MTSVYIVKGSASDYGYNNTWVVAVYKTQDRAEEIAKKLNEFDEYNENFQKRLETEFTEVYERSNGSRKSSIGTDVSIAFENTMKYNEARENWKSENYSPPLELLEVIELLDEPTMHGAIFSHEEMELRE